jgi:hypothetical protein
MQRAPILEKPDKARAMPIANDQVETQTPESTEQSQDQVTGASDGTVFGIDSKPEQQT